MNRDDIKAESRSKLLSSAEAQLDELMIQWERGMLMINQTKAGMISLKGAIARLERLIARLQADPDEEDEEIIDEELELPPGSGDDGDDEPVEPVEPDDGDGG